MGLVFMVSTALAVGPQSGGSHVDVEAGLVHDSNITLAELDDDIFSDQLLQAGFRQTTTRGIDFSTAWGWTVHAEGRAFRDHDELNEIETGVDLFWRRQYGHGFAAPVVEIGAGASLIDSASDIRGGHATQYGAMVTRRVTDRLVARLGARHIDRSARSGRVFNTSRTNLFINADWFLRNDRVVYGVWIFSTGEVVSTARPTLKVVNAASAIEPDDAFGGVDENRFAYRLDADVHIVTLGMNFDLGRKRSADISVEGLTASAEGGNDYDRLRAQLSWLQRF